MMIASHARTNTRPGNGAQPQEDDGHMRIQIETGCYNERRYGRPYIAVVDLDNHKSIPRWGRWIADRPGDEGVLEIEAEMGDIVMHGQRDNRGGKGGPEYAQVCGAGRLNHMSKPDALAAWRQELARRAAVQMAQPVPATIDGVAVAAGW